MSAPKRVLTDDAHAASAARAGNDLISDDLAARLQNIGSRVRKSVTEGYSTPLSQSPTKAAAPTAKETLQQVFGSPARAGSKGGTPSPLKRPRAALEPEDDDDDDGEDEDDVVFAPNIIYGGAFAQRPVRPLRRPRVPQQEPRDADVVMQDACAWPKVPVTVTIGVGIGQTAA
ncbi:hypothetical protein AURDEDRAFT_112914 [Auricularia subglabra TFB-10046 SS5]|nr:hypothetical protein AURDEDRAFT_112914 [Auricularia subglabra TFB-10046 SS5]